MRLDKLTKKTRKTMKIVYKIGNLLDAQTAVIAHQVNCQGVMGSGIAKQIKEKWPIVFEKYHKECDTDSLEYVFGSCLLVGTETHFIANLFGQMYYGRSGRFTDYEALYSSLESLHIQMKEKQLTSVAIPYKMSSDRGGADWDIVLAMIKSIFKDTNVTIEIWSLTEIPELKSKFSTKKSEDSSWQYEADHKDDWKQIHEMCG